jgi:tetratricopeptide (TPR) repeat protein
MTSIEELGNGVIREIKAAHAFRHTEKVKELAGVLINLPLKEYQLIGQYYTVWAEGRERKYSTESLERIIEETTTFKTKAMFSLAAFEGYQGRVDTSLYYYTQALKTSPSASDYIVLTRSIAALKSSEGFHKSALRDLENLLPIIRHAEPQVYFDYLNSYAVELGEAGRKNEARNIIKHVLASPFAFAYPEWFETAAELKPANRSFLVPDPSPARMGMLLRMPQPEYVEAPKLTEPAKIINLQSWKKKMGKDDKENGKPTSEKLKAMTPSEKLIYILQSIHSDFTDDDFDSVIEVLDKINEKKNKP